MDDRQFYDQVYARDTQLGEDGPRCWIQWKGTDVCMDVHCPCGAFMHFDGDFCYFLKCPHCGTTFAVGQNVKLIPLDAEETAFVLNDRPNLIKDCEPDSELEPA